MKKMTLLLSIVLNVALAQAKEGITPELCQVAANGVVTGELIAKTEGSGFYNKASIYAQQTGQCVMADMFGKDNSVRVYQGSTGKRLTQKGADHWDGLNMGAYSCVKFTCIAVLDSKAQTSTGYGTGGYVAPGSVINYDSTVVVPAGSGY